MKIAILSMQRILNYGSLLQAYSLRKMITSLGHDVEFIDIMSSETDNLLINKEDLIDYSSESVFCLSKSCKDLLKKFFLRAKNKIDRDKINKVFVDFQKDVLELSNNKNDEQYDICVIGSDEVFNCLQPSEWGYTSQLFGNVKNAEKVITYAASCGYTKITNVPQVVKNSIRNAFLRVSAFSVRDRNTYEFVQELSNEVPNINLDPVAVGNFDDEILSAKLKYRLPKRFCVLYAYTNRINDEGQIRLIKDFCKKNKMTLVAIGGFHNWINYHPALTPFEVLKAFQMAEFVITDTFHGTIFATKYSKKMAILTHKSNENKLGDLLKRLKIEKHRLSDFSELEKIYGYDVDRKVIDELLISEREKTLQYLAKNLGIEKKDE